MFPLLSVLNGIVEVLVTTDAEDRTFFQFLRQRNHICYNQVSGLVRLGMGQNRDHTKTTQTHPGVKNLQKSKNPISPLYQNSLGLAAERPSL